jgi:hypothetical protein
MLTLYQSLKKILPEVVDAVVKFNETGSFPGFGGKDPRDTIKTFYGVDINSEYDFRFRFYESDRELAINIREGGQLVIDTGVPIENIDCEDVLIDAVKDEIDMILVHWERVLNEFEE